MASRHWSQRGTLPTMRSGTISIPFLHPAHAARCATGFERGGPASASSTTMDSSAAAANGSPKVPHAGHWTLAPGARSAMTTSNS